MTTTSSIYLANPDPAGFARSYLTHVGETLSRIDPAEVSALIEEFLEARKDNRTIFIAGNGGSAATASHMVNDISSDVTRKAALAEPFRVIALTDNVPAITAIANDIGLELIFVNQLKSLFHRGDRLLLISASGNSPNLIRAAEWVRQHGGRVLSLVGFEGGQLKALSDCCVHVRTATGEYGPVEDAHLVINHLISNWLIGHFSGAQGAL